MECRDILFEIWKLTDIVQKRNLALISKWLSKKEEVRKFNMLIKTQTLKIDQSYFCQDEWMQTDFICHPKLVFLRNNSNMFSVCTVGKIYLKTTSPMNKFYIPGSHSPLVSWDICKCFVNTVNDQQQKAIKQWLSRNKIEYFVESQEEGYPRSEAGIYFYCNGTEETIVKTIRWLYLYGFLN